MIKKKILIVLNGHRFTSLHRIPLIKSLSSKNVIICVLPTMSEGAHELKQRNIFLINWKISRKGIGVFKEIKSLIKLYQIYRRESPDIVIHATIKPVIYGSIASFLNKKSESIVNLVTGLGSVFISKGLFEKIVKKFIIIIYNLIFRLVPQTIIFQNKSDKKELLKNNNYPLLNTVIIPGSGVTVSDFPIFDFPYQKRISFIGRIIKDKGIDTFIKAAKKIRSNRKDIIFSLVGPLDSGNPSFFGEEKINKWESEKIVEWNYNVENILDVYNNSSIIVLPSYREGFPKTLLEAGLTGRPVIASDVPGCRDVVVHGKTGYLFPLNDSETFASYILELIDNQEKMKKMGLTGRNHVIENFSSDVIIPQIVNCISKQIN